MKKVDSQVRIQLADLKDLIRDEIYGASIEIGADCSLIAIAKKDIKKLVRRIANRAIVGH